MFFGTGTTSSVIQAAGAPGGGTSASPNALVVLVKMNARTRARTAASSRFSVPVRLVSMKACRLWVATCGLCSVAAWSTEDAPSMQRSTRSEEHTSELQSQFHLVCRLLLEKKKPHSHRQSSQSLAASPPPAQARLTS